MYSLENRQNEQLVYLMTTNFELKQTGKNRKHQDSNLSVDDWLKTRTGISL